jgi:pimeloyl-ACP methyl ester carboxylesterase
VGKVRSKDGTTIAFDRLGDGPAVTTVGTPQEMIDRMRSEPWWVGMEAIAPTLAYDSEVMGDSRGGTIPVDVVGRVTPPTLVLVGGASPAWMIDVGRQIADAMPNGRHRVLEGQEHVVHPELLAPVLAEFFADWIDARYRMKSRKEQS